MDNLDKIYIRKDFDDLDNLVDINNVFTYISLRDNYIILKKIDTITNDEDIVAISREVLEKEFYTVSDFLEEATFIGKSGYFDSMHYYETALYKTFIIVYASDKHWLIYDTFSESIFITVATYDMSKFIPFVSQYDDISFKDISFTKKRVK